MKTRIHLNRGTILLLSLTVAALILASCARESSTPGQAVGSGSEGEPLKTFSQHIVLVPPVEAQAGKQFFLDVLVTNSSQSPWFTKSEKARVAASYHWLDQAGKLLPLEGRRTFFSVPVVNPGQSQQLHMAIDPPAAAGVYTLQVSMVQEGVSWFHLAGATPLAVTVNLK